MKLLALPRFRSRSKRRAKESFATTNQTEPRTLVRVGDRSEKSSSSSGKGKGAIDCRASLPKLESPVGRNETPYLYATESGSSYGSTSFSFSDASNDSHEHPCDASTDSHEHPFDERWHYQKSSATKPRLSEKLAPWDERTLPSVDGDDEESASETEPSVCERTLPSVDSDDEDSTAEIDPSVYEDPTFVPTDSEVESVATMPSKQHLEVRTSIAKQPAPVLTTSSSLVGNLVNQYEADHEFTLGLELFQTGKRLLTDQSREEALKMFRLAAESFEKKIAQGSVLAILQSSRCHRYMSTVCRALSLYNDSVSLLHKLVQQCETARERVEIYASRRNSSALQPASPSDGTNGATTVCLDVMIIETIQFQADVLVKHLFDYEQAIACFDEILRQLLYLDEVKHWEDVLARSVLVEGINFVPITKETHTELLLEALSTVIGYYGTFPASDSSCMVFEDALNLLRQRQEEEFTEDNEMISAVASLYKQLSEIYMSRQEVDRAVIALREFAVVKLTESGEPCSEALQIIDKMGQSYEQMEDYAGALECYELSLLSRCRYFGNTHVSVAEALVDVARVKELVDGRHSEECVNLYRAANAIYALHVKSSKETIGNDSSTDVLRVMRFSVGQGQTRNSTSLSQSIKAIPKPRENRLVATNDSKKDEENHGACEDSVAFDQHHGSKVSLQKDPLLPDPATPLKTTEPTKFQAVEDECDDLEEENTRLRLPASLRFIQVDGDGVTTVLSEDNDIVTLASCDNDTFSSSRRASLGGGQDIVSIDSPTRSRGTKGSSDEGRLQLPVGEGSLKSSPQVEQQQASKGEATKQQGPLLTKIFSLADTVKRMQKSRRPHKTKQKMATSSAAVPAVTHQVESPRSVVVVGLSTARDMQKANMDTHLQWV